MAAVHPRDPWCVCTSRTRRPTRPSEDTMSRVSPPPPHPCRGRADRGPRGVHRTCHAPGIRADLLGTGSSSPPDPLTHCSSKGHLMRRLLIALVAGVVVTVPAAVGLFGNASFAQRLPLRSPTRHAPRPARPRAPPRARAPPSPSPATTTAATARPGVSDDEPGDDHGGDRPRTGDDDNSGPGSTSSRGDGSEHPADDNSGRRLGRRLRRLGRRQLRRTARTTPRPTTAATTAATTADDRHLGPRLERRRAGTTRVATDPTTDPATPEESPAAPAAAGDVSVLADELLGPAEPAVSDTGLGVDAVRPRGRPRHARLGDPGRARAARTPPSRC